MAVPKQVVQLVETFDRNIEAYKNQQYNETQLRREFIDPFFCALGWDVANEQGYAQAYKDVIHEDAIKIGTATKAPDYSFRIGGTRKFFLEAKKPSIDIKGDPHPAYQLRRYAWSAKLPLSILTDFEEFAVYDCQTKPKHTDKAGTARIMYFKYKEYIVKWDKIVGTFSKEAVLKGSFDKFVKTTKGKRGTNTVDIEFLAEIEQWRSMLATTIALKNRSLSRHEINFAVQRTIDRILFLRMCEDRGIETYSQLQGLSNGRGIYQRLCSVFERADAKYNSGLFYFHHEKGRAEPPDELTPNIVIDDTQLGWILRSLYYPQCPYEFSVLPAEILGNVYEQFLGKVIRLTSARQVKIEEKPEVKKAGGVYYTPDYIVDYIVKNTVGRLLGNYDGHCEEQSDEAISNKPKTKNSKLKTPKQIENLRILDPACGSGSFLLGAYTYLLNYHRDWYVENDPQKHTKKIYQGKGGWWFLTIAEKKKILLNNIYGVDIDSQAVEVTKLSLLLKVLEGETSESIGQSYKMFHERALPDLADNIKCGNSLIGPDFFDNLDPEQITDELRNKINPFDWKAEFPQIFSQKNPGFDAVIGNPPYVILSSEFCSAEAISYLNCYHVAQYKMDLFHLFIEKGLVLLNNGGSLGFIVPNPWLTLKFTDRLRKHILENSCIKEIVLFKHLVFQGANVYTSLLFLNKNCPKNHLAIVKKPDNVFDVADIINCPSIQLPQQTWLETESYAIEVRQTGAVGGLIKKIIKNHPKLDETARASLGCQAYNRSKHTAEQIKNRVFHATTKKGKVYLPELAGKDVGRYIIDRQKGQWIKYGPWLHDYRTIDWLEGPRILIREIVGSGSYKIQACYVEETYCNYKTILNVNPKNSTKVSMKYLTGIINSRLMSFVYPFMSNKMIAQSFPRITVGDLRKLPIRTIDFDNPDDKAKHDTMVKLVDRMLDLHKKLDAAKVPDEKTKIQRQINTTDKKIDNLVYELYNLTPDEIAIIESSDKKDK